MERAQSESAPPELPRPTPPREHFRSFAVLAAAMALWTVSAMLLLVVAVAITAALAPAAFAVLPGVARAAGVGRALVLDGLLLCASAVLAGAVAFVAQRWVRLEPVRSGMAGAAVLLILFAWSAFVDDAAPRMPLHLVLWLGCVPVFVILYRARALHAFARSRPG